ncbi:MAG: methyl-accepting chemotaxis protein [Kiritimatiellae bacterium]|nr:methyl-accepting chemotaxis protein [Kiritimatiellia bacterium]
MKWTLGKKLVGGFSAVAIIMLFVGVVGYYGTNETAKSLQYLGENRIPDLQTLGVLNFERMSTRADTLDVLVLENQPYTAVAYEKILGSRAKTWQRVDAAWERLLSIPRATQRGRDIVASLGTQYAAWRKHYAGLDATIARLAKTSDPEKRSALYQEYQAQVTAMIPDSNAMGETFDLLTENNITNTAKKVEHDSAFSSTLKMIVSIVLVIGLAGALALGFLISRSISKPIRALAGVAGLLASRNKALAVGALALSAGDLAKAANEGFVDEAGQVDMRRYAARGDEVGDLAQAVQQVQCENEHVAEALQNIRSVLLDVISRTIHTCEEQKKGDMDARNNLSGLQGEYARLAAGVNEALDGIVQPLSEGIAILNEYADGNFGREMRELPGKQVTLSNSLRSVRVNILGALERVGELTSDMLCGKLNNRTDTGAFGGRYKELMESLNALVNSLVGIIETIPTPLFTIDPEMNIRFVNSAAAGVLGLSGEECVGTKCFSHFKTPQCNTSKCATGRCMRENQVVSEETDAHPNGMTLDIEYKGIPLHDHDGKVVGGLEFITDLTDIKTAQRLTAKRGEYQAGEVGKLGTNLALLADGDFNFEVATDVGDADTANEKKTFDSINKSLENTRNNLSAILAEVRDSIEQVNSGAEQISDASQSLSQGATEQASSLEEITSSVTEIASQTKTNAENANQANSLADSVRKAAEKGSDQMTQMVESMNSIDASSQQIAKIIKVIDDIAFQTNLLALNAAVEAARAGRHGKGFAVVADEVRNLAGRSAKAAKETAELIESSGAKTSAGMEVATSTAESFKDIVSGIVKTNDLVGEIAAASNEQAQGVSQINIGLSQVDQVTQQNTANAEETASAAEELSSQSTHLQGLVAKFKLRGGSRQQAALPSGGAHKGSRGLSAKQSKPRGDVSKSGWGDHAAKPAEDGDIINLDDREFGKY